MELRDKSHDMQLDHFGRLQKGIVGRNHMRTVFDGGPTINTQFDTKQGSKEHTELDYGNTLDISKDIGHGISRFEDSKIE